MIPAPMSAVPLTGSLLDSQSSQSRKGIPDVSKTFQGSDMESSEAGRKVLEDKALTAAEISKHKRDEDAWIVVDGVVYDITSFLQTHPGGVEVFSPFTSTGFPYILSHGPSTPEDYKGVRNLSESIIHTRLNIEFP